MAETELYGIEGSRTSDRNEAVKRETTSLKIRPDLWKKAKIEAINKDTSLSKLIEELLEQYFSKGAGKQGSKMRVGSK